MAADTLCRSPFGDFRIRRFPSRGDEPLQAWCAADLLLLEEIHRLDIPGTGVLTVNDDHGAISVALEARELWTDSLLSALALEQNLSANGRGKIAVTWSTDLPAGDAAAVALRIPRQLPYFAYQLAQLGRLLPQGTLILAAGMDKHLSPRVAALLEQYIGPTTRHRGQRKARLFSARLEQQSNPAPIPGAAKYYCEAVEGELRSHPNVFSQDRLDGGSRVLLQQLPALEPATTVADLACGNGVLGLAAFKRGLATKVVFADESAMALASARSNAELLFPDASFSFHHGDGLRDFGADKPELILCNPPFHMNNAVDEYAGRRLLDQCAQQLPAGGRLCLVANQHLDYMPTLKRNFGRVEKIGRDRRFTVWLAQRR